MVLRKIGLLSALIVFTASIAGCNSTNLNSVPQFYNSANNVEEPPVSIKVVLDSPPFVTGANSELSGVAKMADGKLIKYMTVKTSGKASATTIVYSSKWVTMESHRTTASEAETILKLARQGGFAKEYKELQTRYTELGLI